MSEQPQPTAPKKGRNLPVAIAVGVGLLAAVLVGLFLAPWFFVGLVALGLCLAAVEIHRALTHKNMHSSIRVIVAGTAVSVLGGYLMMVAGGPDRDSLTSRIFGGVVDDLNRLGITPLAFVVVCVVLTMLIAVSVRIPKGPQDFIYDAAASGFILIYITMCGVFLPLLMGAPSGEYRVVIIILCAVAADTGAFAVGSLLGRHKMAPKISPNKTWEGFAGALAIAAVVGGVFLPLLFPRLGDGIDGWVLGVVVALAATVGDLMASMIKRDAGIKDMSNMLPGHGGIMDRLDSMLVAMPVGWLVLELFL